MDTGYTPTTEEVLRYIQRSHREYLRAVEKNYQKWVKQNPIVKKPRPKPKSKPIKKKDGDIELSFD